MKRLYIFFISSIITLSFFSFYPAFGFSFIIDDWYQLWGVFYDKSIIDYYIRTQHPNSAYEFLIFAPLFKFNPFYYQIIGYFLKIIDSLVVALFVFSTTKSRKVAFFSGVVFAASVIGIETFTRISAHNSALLIPSLGLGLFFWIEATRHESFYRYLIAISFIVLTILQDPGVGIIILPAALLWNLLNLIRNFNKQQTRKLLLRTIMIISLPVFLKWYLDPRRSDRNSYITRHLSYILNHPLEVTTNFLTSIGNLLIGWFIPFEETVGLVTSNFWTTTFGYLAFLFTLVIGLIFLRKKSETSMILFYLSIWVFLFYFPNWFTQSHYVEGGTISSVSNRYLAISSIGFIGLISYLTSFLKSRIRMVLFIFIIFLNIWSSLRILNNEHRYRSLNTQNLIFNIIDQDLPKGEERNKILMVLGDYDMKVAGFEWNGFYPIALKRGITNQQQFSTIVNNLEDAKKLLCNRNMISKYKISEFYSWKVQNNTIENISEEVRLVLRKDCEES